MTGSSVALAALSGVAAPLVLLGSLAAPGVAATVAAEDPRPGDLTANSLEPTRRIESQKSSSGRLAESSAGLLRRDDSAPVRVLIKLDYDAVASYQGGVDGLRATSPLVTGRSLAADSRAVQRYTAHLRAQERSFVSALDAAVPAAEVTRSYRVVYGGVAAVIPGDSARRILAIDGVVAVQRDRVEQLLTDASPDFLNTAPVYDELGSTAGAGKGVIYGNLDTGVWPEHPSFEDRGNLKPPPGPDRECNFGDNPRTRLVDDPFVCQNKLIGGAHFTDTYDAVVGDDPFEGTARDSEGHGTHTASTSAGNIVRQAPIFDIDRGPLHGLAPGASVMVYKVCGPFGCLSSDSTAAVQQAVLDGVDVINFSISGGVNPFADPTELAFLDAYAAGVFVAASAGNDGPDAATVNHRAPWVTTVAASTQTREFATTLTLSADGGDTATFDGASITPGVDEPRPVVLAETTPGYEDALCTTPAPAGTFAGALVACERGGNARVEKGFNVRRGGAEGMVLYNPSLQDVETDSHWLPTVHLADDSDFLAFMADHAGVVGSFPAGEARSGQGDVMAAFSSRGPGGLFVKPDVTAPGVQILAGDTPVSAERFSGPRGEFFQAIAGTSMSSPHVAGAALLARAVHPDWTPGQIKSALMTTAITTVVKEDTTTPADPFDFGAGRINTGRSIYAPLTLDETAANYATMGDDPVQAVHLNLPSINAPIMPGRLVTNRTVTNTSGLREDYQVRSTAPADSTISVSPQDFTVGAGRSRTLRIVIRSDATLGEQQFGSIRLVRSTGGGRMHLPVAFVHTQGSVSLTQSCSPATVQLGGRSHCVVEAANQGFDGQTVDLESHTSEGLPIVDAVRARLLDRHNAQRRGITLDGASPGVPSVSPGASPAGYLPLDDFDVSSIGVGDEEILNFDVPAFQFNGQTWTSVGVTSNGYLVAGGGTAEDVEFDPPAGPDPARPNNVMAPFWTDLDGAGAPGVFIGLLGDETDSWIVAESRLNVFGTDDMRTFQVWIGVNGVQDVSYAYDPGNLPADPNGQDLLVGAENVLGAGDMASDLPTEDLRVESSDAVPGDVASYELTVRGVERGIERLRSEMSASRVSGVTVVKNDLRVIRRR